MIGGFITAAVLYLLLSMKTGVCLRWESGSAVLKVRIGAFRFSLSSNEKKTPKNEAVSAPGGGDKNRAPVKKWVRALLDNWRDVLALVSKILRTPKLDLLRIYVTVGGDDPEVCAMRYGQICAGFSAGLPLVQRLFSVGKQDIDVSCNFDRTGTDILGEIEATVRVYEILALLVSGLALLLKLYRHTKTSEKAVQNQ